MPSPRTIALGLALGLSLPHRPAAARIAPAEAEPDVAPLLRRADAAFEEGRLLDAWDAIDEAEAIQPGPFYEYMRGRIRQAQGRCDLAVEHWARYLDSDPAESDAADVRGLIEECGGLPKPAPAPAPEPTPAPEPNPEPTPPPTAGPIEDPPGAARGSGTAWHRDLAGGVLLGVGVASLATGGALWAVAGQQQRRGPREPSLMLHDTRIRRARGLSYGAIAAGTVGVALVVGAIVRYRKVRRASSGAPQARQAWGPGLGVRF